MSSMPTDLRVLRDESLLHVTWPESHCDFPLPFLRRQCECAHCVNEWTGEKILDPASIPEDITILKMDLVGSYAVRIEWSDGHNSGLFTWDRLRDLSSRL